ncbi:MAG: hypothetical protein D6681_20310 [Calditrichaeota bacterium]|nr:MAG: hypothetical protein D6681_20310 [Calditrichota bacterium]
MSTHAKKIVDELCNYLGYDFDSPMCKELHEHVQNCPECRAYIESIKKTVKICQTVYKVEPLPEEVKQELLRKLQQKKHPSPKTAK